MPTYEYKCPECEKSIQVVRGILDEDPGYQCDTCNMNMNKVYFLSGISFNGSGFYSKDK